MTLIYGVNRQFRVIYFLDNFKVRYIPIGEEEILLPGEHKHGAAVQNTVDIRLCVEQAQQRLIPAIIYSRVQKVFLARRKGLNIESCLS